MTSFPPVPTSSAGKFRGVFVGTVEDNRDEAPANPGFRVRVTIDTLGAGFRTFWARVVVPMGGNERGTYFLPQKGEQVLVVFEHGNMNRTPIVLGTMWSSKHQPPETNRGENNTKLIQTSNKHRIIFDDKTGAEKVTIVDSSGNNKIQIDSASNKVTIQSDGDLEIVAEKGAIFHAKDLKIHAKGDLKQTGMNVAAHAKGQMALFGPAMVTGASQINMNPTPACTVVASPSGFLEGDSASENADSAQEQPEQGEAAVGAQGANAPQPPKLPQDQLISQAEANPPGMSDATAAAIAGGAFLAGAAGMAAGAMAGQDGMFDGMPSAAGLSGVSGLGGGAAAPGSGGLSENGPGGLADAGPSGSGASSAFAADAADAGTTGDGPAVKPFTAAPPRSDAPQWGTAQAGDVGHDVKGRASASASVSASGVDVFTSSSSSVFQESAVSRATNPAQVPDLAVQVTSQADQLASAADPAKEASSHIRPLPLEPTPPVVEPRSAAAAAAPSSVRSAVDTAGQAESSTSDARAYMKDPEQGAESVARSMVNERIEVAHPMGAKGEVNSKVSTYGDQNMFVKQEVDHQVDRGEAAAKLKVTDENFSTGGSISTEDDPDAPPVAKVSSGFGDTDPKQPGSKTSQPDPKKPGSK